MIMFDVNNTTCFLAIICSTHNITMSALLAVWMACVTLLLLADSCHYNPIIYSFLKLLLIINELWVKMIIPFNPYSYLEIRFGARSPPSGISTLAWAISNYIQANCRHRSFLGIRLGKEKPCVLVKHSVRCNCFTSP